MAEISTLSKLHPQEIVTQAFTVAESRMANAKSVYGLTRFSFTFELLKNAKVVKTLNFVHYFSFHYMRTEREDAIESLIQTCIAFQAPSNYQVMVHRDVTFL